MAKVGLIRVDSRLIHGQVITKWLTYSKANRIIVVDNELSKDSFMADIYAISAPSGIDVEILSIKDFIKSWKSNQCGDGILLILIKEVSTIYDLYKLGFSMRHVQLGGLPSGPDKKAIYKSVYLSKNEIQKLKEMAEEGIYIDMQVIPEDTKADFIKMI